jgi:hypothetical protein
VNGYVTGGWSVTAGFLAVYTWRLMHRGRLLSQALPPAQEPSFDGGGSQEPSFDGGGSQEPSFDGGGSQEPSFDGGGSQEPSLGSAGLHVRPAVSGSDETAPPPGVTATTGTGVTNGEAQAWP